MTDPTITDLRRELEKAQLALIDAMKHLGAHAEMNAALHCADRVMYSPLHARVDSAIQGIDFALARTESAVTSTAAIPPHSDNGCPWYRILADLDRCQHGRHQGDPCGPADACDGASAGNPHMPSGQVIGYSLRRGPIVMPDRDHKHDLEAWRGTGTGEPK